MKKDETWGIRSNKEINLLIEKSDIDICKVPKVRLVRTFSNIGFRKICQTLYKWRPSQNRTRGSLMKRKSNDVEEDLSMQKVINWRMTATDGRDC